MNDKPKTAFVSTGRLVRELVDEAYRRSRSIAGSSGDWLCDIGLPGEWVLGTYSPRLDAAGSSVRGQLAARFLSEQLGRSLFASRPEP